MATNPKITCYFCPRRPTHHLASMGVRVCEDHAPTPAEPVFDEPADTDHVPTLPSFPAHSQWEDGE